MDKSQQSKYSIYILECENNKYYVGRTTDIDTRVAKHFNHDGAEWTKKHQPIKIIQQIEDCDKFDEDSNVLRLMEKHGIENVRGGAFSQVQLSDSQLTNIKTLLASANDRCFHCNSTEHFAKECPTKKGHNAEEHIYIEDKTPNHDQQHQSKHEIMKKIDEQRRIPRLCVKCGRDNHTIRNCRAVYTITGQKIADINCTLCGRANHQTKDCYAKRHINGSPIKVFCTRCRRDTHTMARCHASVDIDGKPISVANSKENSSDSDD